MFTGFGQRGISAESVAKKTANLVKEYLKYNVPVGKYLADQILIPMALAGNGSFKTLPLTEHTKTNIVVIQKFLDVKFEVKTNIDRSVEITIRSDK